VTVQIATDPASGQLTAIFTIPGTDAEAVSVVGSFNDWTAGQHTLEPMEDGSLAVTVVLRSAEDLHFRYLDSNGAWFDDPDADAITEYGSFVSLDRSPAGPTQPAAFERADSSAASDPTGVGSAPLAEDDPTPSETASTAPTKAKRATKQRA
jgi:hypothetical protein